MRQTKLKVFTWNILSEAFFTPDDYPTYDPMIFDGDRKELQVLAKIEEMMSQGALIALQEVCDGIRSELVKLAVNAGYVIRDAAYGGTHSWNTGTALLWPQEYELLHYEQVVVGEQINYFEEKPSRNLWQWLTWQSPSQTPLEYAKSRKNVLIVATLALKSDPSQKVTMSVYHVPCAIHMREVMKYHVETVWDICHRVNDPPDASAVVPPLIICMDMNTTPTDPLYEYLPSKGMISAHEFEGREPDFTTNTQSKFNTEPFKATIDYVWVSWGKIAEVKSRLPTKFTRLLPNDKFPSDHYWMEFDLTFK